MSTPTLPGHAPPIRETEAASVVGRNAPLRQSRQTKLTSQWQTFSKMF